MNQEASSIPEVKLKDEYQLEDLVKEANVSLLKERRAEAITQIRALFVKASAISRDIQTLDSKRKKMVTRLEKTQKVINDLKAGNWAILANLKNLLNEKEDNKENKET